MTDKKIWTAPRVSFVRFAANEYVNACTSRTVYDFLCNLVDRFLLFDTKNNGNNSGVANYNAAQSSNALDSLDSPYSYSDFSAAINTGDYNNHDQLFYYKDSTPNLGHTHPSDNPFSFTLEEDQKNSLPTVWYNATENLESTVWNPAYIWHDTTQNILHASSAMNSRTVSNHS